MSSFYDIVEQLEHLVYRILFLNCGISAADIFYGKRIAVLAKVNVQRTRRDAAQIRVELLFHIWNIVERKAVIAIELVGYIATRVAPFLVHAYDRQNSRFHVVFLFQVKRFHKLKT